MISLIIPTRKRPELLGNLCLSIHETTYNHSNIEAFVIHDNDETVNLSYPWLNIISRSQGNSLSVDYQNWIFPRTKGEYIFVLNDDTQFQTYHWDKIAMDKITSWLKPDGFVYGWISDNHDSRHRFGKQPNPYSCFPILSRKSIDALGYVMTPFYGGWSADVYLYKVYNSVDRVLDLSEIIVQHYSHWLGTKNRDEASYSMERMSTNKDVPLDPTNDIEKLLRWLRPTLL